MTSIWTDRLNRGRGDPKCCRAAVYDREGGGSWFPHQCHRKPVVERDVDGKMYGFCKQHDPVAVETKSKARSAAWDAERKARDEQYEINRKTAAAMNACKVAIERIAAGHNDPSTLAVETLALFP